MDIELNWLAIVLATVAAMVVGSIWYNKRVFGKKWQRLAGISDKQIEQGGWMPIGIAAVASFILAFGLANSAYLGFSFYDVSFLNAALSAAFWSWLAFSLTTLVMHNSFEVRRKKLTLLNSSYQLVLFLSVGLVIGLIGV